MTESSRRPRPALAVFAELTGLIAAAFREADACLGDPDAYPVSPYTCLSQTRDRLAVIESKLYTVIAAATADVDPVAAELAQDFDDPTLLEVHAADRHGIAVCGDFDVITTRVYGDVTCEACRLMVAPSAGETVYYRPAPRRFAGACGRIAPPERITAEPTAVTCPQCRTVLDPTEPPSTGGRLTEGSK